MGITAGPPLYLSQKWALFTSSVKNFVQASGSDAPPQSAGKWGGTIDDYRVIFLLENHSSRKDFEKIRRVIENYCDRERDLILLENSHALSRKKMLECELSRGRERYRLFRDKKIAGWDHEMRNKWSEELRKNPSVTALNRAIESLEEGAGKKKGRSLLLDALDLPPFNKSSPPSSDVDALDLASPHYFSGIQRHLSLLAKAHRRIYGPLPMQKKFSQLRKILIDSGRQAIRQLENRAVELTFSLRQAELLSAIERNLNSLGSSEGKIFVIAGKNHLKTDSLSDRMKNEVVKLLREVEKFSPFLLVD